LEISNFNVINRFPLDTADTPLKAVLVEAVVLNGEGLFEVFEASQEEGVLVRLYLVDVNASDVPLQGYRMKECCY